MEPVGECLPKRRRGELLISYHSRKSYHPIFSQTVKAEDAVNALKHAAIRKYELQKRK